MRFWGFTALFAAAMGLVFAGCEGESETSHEAPTSASVSSSSSSGGGGEGQGGAWTGMSVTEEFCGAIAKPFCEALFSCCSAPVILDAYGGKVDACEETMSADCLGDTAAQIEASIAAGQTILDEDQLDQCVKKLDAMSKGDAACIEPPRLVLLTDCVAAYRGQIAPGDACSWSSDDLSFVHCKDGLCQQGSCVPLGVTGATCSSSPNADKLCNYTKGEWCIGESLMGTCGPRGDIGAACNYPGSSTYECKSKSCGLDGKCIAPTSEGMCESAG